MGGNQNHHNQ
jgi:hypothetical protein